MKVLNIAGGADTGGTGQRIREAFLKYAPDWEYRNMAKSAQYMAYPTDLPYRKRLLEQMWATADVIHVRNNFGVYDPMVYKHGRKPVVLHCHGTAYRSDPDRTAELAAARNAPILCSTLDLWLLHPDQSEWLPSPYNVDWLQSLRAPHGTDKVVIAHAPTNRQVKSTAEFLVAFQRLQDEGYPVELELIERAPWSECLTRKARADIFYDQTILGYGNNALEAWGMGIPVIAGGSDETMDEMERRFGHLPFYHATEDTIYDALKELVQSPELRERYGRIGHDYVRKYHDEPVVVRQLKRLYERAVNIAESRAA